MKYAGNWCLTALMLVILLIAGNSGASSAVTNASVTTSSLLTGATASYEYGFTATSGLPIGATISVTYPAGFNVASATKTQYSSYYSLQGITGQTITYNVLSPVNAGGNLSTFFMQTDGIVNPSIPGTYALQIATSSDPTPVSVPVTITATGGAVTDASVTTSSLLTGATASYEYGFTATSGLPIGATISVTYPAGFNVASATKTQYSSYYSLQGITGQTITYSVLSPVNAGSWLSSGMMQTNGIVNPSSPGTYALQIATSSDPTPVSVPVTITATGGVVTNAIVTTSSLLTGATTSYEYGFTATSGLPIGATISVTYPAGFNVASASKTQYSSYYSLQGITGQTIIYNVLFPVNAGSWLSSSVMQTDGIVNPSSPGTYALQIATSSDPTPVSVPVTITSTGGAVTNASVTTSSLLTGATASYEYEFRATSGLPTGATISVTYPAGFNVASATKTQASSYYSLQGISGQTIIYNVLFPVNAGSWLSSSVMQTDGIVNPSIPGTYALQIATSSDPTPVSVPVTITQPVFYTLTLGFAGTGGGDVNGDISCSKGGTCTPVSFSENTIVTLIATHDTDSIFSGWSSECRVTGTSCEVTIDKAKTVVASFSLADKARIWSKPYQSLSAAFAESLFGQIHARAIVFEETLYLTQAADFKGGFDSEFANNDGNYTILKGSLLIGGGGSLIVEGLTIR